MKASYTFLLLFFFFIPAILTAPIPQNLHPYDEDVDGKPAYYNVIAEANRAGLNPGFGIPSKPKEYEKPEEIPKWDPGNAGMDEYNAAIKAAMKEQGFDFDLPSYRS